MIRVAPSELTIAAMWLDFANDVMPANAPDIQRVEMRKSFYAGFLQCLGAMADVSAQMPEPEACKLLDRLQEEAKAFLKVGE